MEACEIALGVQSEMCGERSENTALLNPADFNRSKCESVLYIYGKNIK